MRKSVQIRLRLEKEFPHHSFSQAMADKIKIFLDYLIKWNRKMNLTGFKDYETMFNKLVLDSLSIFKTPASSLIHKTLTPKVIDLGTGAGIPGLIIAICKPNIEIESIDSSQKKIAFQRIVQANLNLSNFHPINSRIEDLMQDISRRHVYDIILSRALTQIKVLLHFSSYFLKKGGRLICWKGDDWRKESNFDSFLASDCLLENEFSYQFESCDHHGALVIFKKT